MTFPPRSIGFTGAGTIYDSTTASAEPEHAVGGLLRAAVVRLLAPHRSSAREPEAVATVVS